MVECSSNWIDQIYPVYLSCHIFSVLLFTQAFVSGGLPHRDGSVHLGVDYFARSADVCFNQVGHHHYSPTSSASSSLFASLTKQDMGVNWALVEYSSDDRNMYDIEIHGWSTFQFSELCHLSDNVKTLGDMICPQSFCLVKSHCGKDLWPKLV